MWVCSVTGKSAHHAFWKELGSTADNFYGLFLRGIFCFLFLHNYFWYRRFFKTLLKALGRFSLYHPPNRPCVVQWELRIFSIKAEPTLTCGSRYHTQQDTPYLSLHPTLRHLTLFSDIPNNPNWKSLPILTAYPHPGTGRHRLSEGYPSRAMLAKTPSGTRVWTVGQLRILGFFLIFTVHRAPLWPPDLSTWILQLLLYRFHPGLDWRTYF